MRLITVASFCIVFATLSGVSPATPSRSRGGGILRAGKSLRDVTKGIAAVGKPSSVLAADDDCVKNPWPADRQNNRLPYGTRFGVGSTLTSKKSILTLNAQGSLVLSQKKDGRVLWASPAAPSGVTPDSAFIMSDGLNLMGTDRTAYWTTNTSVSANAVLVLVDSCDLVLFGYPPFTSPQWSTGTGRCLDVHIVPHSHDDVGWLLTPERYYDGCYNPDGGVQSIIRSMVEALDADHSRTFVQVEQYFFHRWWTRQDDAMKKKARAVIDRGQFVFINGGWSMHDEACVHHESVINNMAIGAQFLRDKFNVTVNVGWHLDPFGHASATPRLFSQMGFDSLWFQRVDYQHREQMIKTRTLESVWNPSPDALGPSHAIFTSIMADGYCKGCEGGMCPSGFCCFTCEDALHMPQWAHELRAASRAWPPRRTRPSCAASSGSKPANRFPSRLWRTQWSNRTAPTR